jgi:hypothetical protein
MSDLSLNASESRRDSLGPAVDAQAEGVRPVKLVVAVLLGLAVGGFVGAVVAVFTGLLPFLC